MGNEFYGANEGFKVSWAYFILVIYWEAEIYSCFDLYLVYVIRIFFDLLFSKNLFSIKLRKVFGLEGSVSKAVFLKIYV